MKGREFLDVRRFLLDLEGEASQRTRTSRAYYAAFHEAQDLASRTLEYRARRNPNDHGALIMLLSSVNPGLAENLDHLRKLRNIADYELDAAPRLISEQVLWSGRLAILILEQLDALATERASLTAGPEPGSDIDDALEPDQR